MGPRVRIPGLGYRSFSAINTFVRLFKDEFETRSLFVGSAISFFKREKVLTNIALRAILVKMRNCGFWKGDRYDEG